MDNNIWIRAQVLTKNKAKKRDKLMIKIMLESVVKNGFSYNCNDDLHDDVIAINKSVSGGITKNEIVIETMESLRQHKDVEDVIVLNSELCPYREVHVPYHAPLTYIDRNIQLS